MKKLFLIAVGILAFSSAATVAQMEGKRIPPTQEECEAQSNQCGGGLRVCCANTRLNHP